MKPVEFDFHGGAQTVAFSDDNRLLAVAYPDSLAVWDVSDTSFPWQTKQHQLSAIAFAFSPDSNTVAVASTNDSIELVPLDILATPRTIGIDGGVTALSFSSDGLWLAAAGKDGVKIWQQDATDALLSRGSGQYLTVAITPFGRCIALTLDRETAEVWDATLDNQVSALRHSQELTTAALSKNGQVAVTATLAGDLWIWKASFGWDRPRSSETLLTRFTGAPKKASVKDRANPTPIHRRQVEQRSEESRSPSGRPPLGAHSVTAQESAPAQPKLPAVSVRAEKPPGAPPQEEPTEDAQITPEPVRSAEADAFADPQDESADQAEDQKNPDKKTKNIFRKVLAIFK
jgi:WD40 repeat protein